MAIDYAFLERVAAIGVSEKIFPGGSVLILGDCNFFTSWSSGNSALDRAKFQETYNLDRVETVDIAGNPSIRLDLQDTVPPELQGQFDMVIDAGTLFWCFDVPAVLENCLRMLKDRGTMAHICALTGHFGRGYYNIHPKLFKDFYEQNGFEIISTEVRVHKQMSCLAALQRKFWELRGRTVGEFRRIPVDAVFLENADFVSMKFTSEVAAKAPMLPNDALFLCAARRSRRSDFVRPLPSLF
jgi:SAM-dependent methyltransferase